MKLYHDDYYYGWRKSYTITFLAGLVILIAFVMMIAGCSTMQLSSDATADQKKAALCSDAQMGVTLAQTIMATTNMTPEQATYWARYLSGAQAILKASCM